VPDTISGGPQKTRFTGFFKAVHFFAADSAQTTDVIALGTQLFVSHQRIGAHRRTTTGVGALCVGLLLLDMPFFCVRPKCVIISPNSNGLCCTHARCQFHTPVVDSTRLLLIPCARCRFLAPAVISVPLFLLLHPPGFSWRCPIPCDVIK
jgi:hypothetical protein